MKGFFIPINSYKSEQIGIQDDKIGFLQSDISVGTYGWSGNNKQQNFESGCERILRLEVSRFSLRD